MAIDQHFSVALDRNARRIGGTLTAHRPRGRELPLLEKAHPVMQDEAAVGLHRASGVHQLPREAGRHGEGLPSGHVFQRHPRGTVEDDAAGAVVAVLKNKHHRPVKVRVPELGHSDEKSRGESLHRRGSGVY